MLPEGGGGLRSQHFFFCQYLFKIDVYEGTPNTEAKTAIFLYDVIDTGFLQTQQAACVWLPPGSFNVRIFKMKSGSMPYL